ncbi:hypothetical protein [Paenibacillus sp. RC84]|uniref:hypothetical protein n=1 Tax=Paenibacillus sp. RC84 TaxID=3156252 RepID=UPI003515AB78
MGWRMRDGARLRGRSDAAGPIPAGGQTRRHAAVPLQGLAPGCGSAKLERRHALQER